MRTDEERIKAMHERAAALINERSLKKVRITMSVSAAACVLCVVILAAFMPHLMSQGSFSDAGTASMSASIFADSSIMGYIVIGIVAFLLGVSVTVFCFRLKKWQERPEDKAGGTSDAASPENDG